MCPKYSPLATRLRASAFNAAAMSAPIRPDVTEAAPHILEGLMTALELRAVGIDVGHSD